MSAIDDLADCRRRALCDVLDVLGADGVAAWHSGESAEVLLRVVFTHVQWLEECARWSALEDAANMVERDLKDGGAFSRYIRAMQPKDIE